LSVIILPTNSLALGLGGIEVNSFLNQPLKAEIEVISARAGEIDNLLVTLASRDAFARAGLSRPSELDDIKFTIEKSEQSDKAVILVTTKSAIKEPFLNFLVEADWSNGRLLREFTILLDPPFYAASPAPASTQTAEPQAAQSAEVSSTAPKPEVPQPIAGDEPSEVSSTSEQQTITEPIALSDENQVADNRASQMQSSGVVSQGDVVIEKGDTLWSIASALQGSGYSMSQKMLAIQRANPNAFGNENINNLKIGSVLRMPDADEMGAVDQQQAYAQVLEQNGLWDDYVARVTGQTDLSTGRQAGATSSTADSSEASGELKLVTPGDGSSDAAGLQSEGDDANELRLQLTLAEEELDASRVQNKELESRIAELEAQLSKFEELQKMIEIEDDSLAKIQENQSREAEEVILEDAIPELQASVDEDALLEELLAEEAASQSEEVAGTGSADSMAEENAVSDTMQESDEMAADASEDSNTQTVTPPPPVIVTESIQQDPSFLDSILPANMLDLLPDLSGLSGGSLFMNPVLLGGLGGILLLIIGLVLYRRRKAGEDVQENDPIFTFDGDDDEEELTPIHLGEGVFEGTGDDSEVSITEEAVLPASMTEEDDVEEDDFSKTAVISAEDMPAQEAPAEEEQDDILNEADVYLAYNLYDNAEELLTSSLEANPERADYRAKLLDTHFATKNVSSFVVQAETLKSMGAPADRYWDRVMVMGFELAPENDLFAAAKDSGISAADLEFSKPAAADFDLGVDEDETNFSTTDFDLGEEDTGRFESTDFSSADLGAGTETPDLDDMTDLSDDDFLVDEDSTDLPDSEEIGELDDLDFDFGDDEETNKPAMDAGAEKETGGDEDMEDMEFGLPDDHDLGGDEIDLGTEATAVMEAGTAVIDTSSFTSDDDVEDEEDDLEATAVLSSVDITGGDDVEFVTEDDTVAGPEDEDEDDGDDIMFDIGDLDDIDSLSMDEDEGADETGTQTFAPGDMDDSDALSIEEDMDAEASKTDTFGLGDIDDSDSLSIDVDMAADDSKTDTFAPGDFDDPEEIEAFETDISSAGLDDIEDLMLPDDVDEVSTKLDLARAFLDMGDAEGARSSLEEVMAEGNDEQKAEAQELINQL
jgi:pilus assembly protein FimV